MNVAEIAASLSAGQKKLIMAASVRGKRLSAILRHAKLTRFPARGSRFITAADRDHPRTYRLNDLGEAVRNHLKGKP